MKSGDILLAQLKALQRQAIFIKLWGLQDTHDCQYWDYWCHLNRN